MSIMKVCLEVLPLNRVGAKYPLVYPVTDDQLFIKNIPVEGDHVL